MNGNLVGSWTRLNRGNLIANRIVKRQRLIMPWFTRGACEQVLVPQYDGSSHSIRIWLNEAAGIS